MQSGGGVWFGVGKTGVCETRKGTRREKKKSPHSISRAEIDLLINIGIHDAFISA